jgi:surface protein
MFELGMSNTPGFKFGSIPVGNGGASIFESTWNTAAAGTSNNQQITLPLESTGNYNFTVNWGDGSENSINTYNAPAVTHTYNSSGNYTIRINGTIEGFRFNDGGDKLKISNVSSWGPLVITSNASFRGCANMTCNASDVPTVATANCWNMFRGCTSFNGNLNSLDVSEVTGFTAFFLGATSFNSPLDSWNTSNAVDMESMFSGATAFNQSVNSWNMSKVTIPRAMFRGTAFNQDLSSWNTSNFGNASEMFYDTPFDQDISGWDFESTTNLANFLFSSTLSTTNYDALLVSLNSQTLTANVPFHAGSSTYTANSPASTARANIISTYNWAITDGGTA